MVNNKILMRFCNVSKNKYFKILLIVIFLVIYLRIIYEMLP